jgi:hypothetical protein
LAIGTVAGVLSNLPVAGKHYPRSTGEFGAWFATDADCLDYIEWLRWPEGFVCPRCAHPDAWRMKDGKLHHPVIARAGVLYRRIFRRGLGRASPICLLPRAS